MKILFIGGNHPRHLFYINKIQEKLEIGGAVIQLRENLLPSPPEGINEIDRKNFIYHFKKRENAERHYFKAQAYPKCQILQVKTGSLNSAKTVKFVKSVKPDVALIFGTGMIKEPLLSTLPRNSINLHLGISPRYRGSATLFWPFYFMEPPYAGCTFHYIVNEPDAGDVVHQVVPELNMGDGIHDVACKAVVAAAVDGAKLLDIFKNKGGWKIHKQQSTGKKFLADDFKPEHLRVIYNVFNDDMVKYYLEGKLASKKPKLIRQF